MFWGRIRYAVERHEYQQSVRASMRAGHAPPPLLETEEGDRALTVGQRRTLQHQAVCATPHIRRRPPPTPAKRI